jgi:hypothetical protein
LYAGKFFFLNPRLAESFEVEEADMIYGPPISASGMSSES